MKKIFLLLFAVIALLVNPSYAGFLVKKNTTKTAVKEMVTAKTESAVSNFHAADATATHAAVQKQSFLKKVFYKISHPEDVIHPALYVVCSVFWLGWLAMGINDDFEDHDWLICLLLYFLFYFPGLIYSLIKMSKYY